MFLRYLVLLLLIFINEEVKACRLYCEECPQIRAIRPYYCCLENWQTAPVVKCCGEKANQLEWVCPTDPIVRPQAMACSGCHFNAPHHCEYDEECSEENTTPLKCCYDSAIGARVCKSAIPRNTE